MKEISLHIRADNVVRRRGYCDHFVTRYVCVGMRVGVYVGTTKRKLLIGMT